MTHTIPRFAGAESQKTDPGMGAGWSRSTLQKFYSNYSYGYAPTGAVAHESMEIPTNVPADALPYAASPALANIWFSFHLYIDTLPGGGQYAVLYSMAAGGGLDRFIRISSAGKVSFYTGAAWGADSAVALSAGQWYQVSMKWYQNVEWRLIVRNPTTLSEVMNITAVASNDDVAFLRFGQANFLASYGLYYFDNIVLEGAAVAANIDDPFTLLGCNYAEWVLVPNATGTDNGMAAGTWAEVDEIPKDDDATIVQFANPNPWTVNVFNPDAGGYPYTIQTIEGLDVCSWSRRLAAGTASSTIRMRRGASAWDSTSVADLVTYQERWRHFTLDPTDSAAWTPTRVNEVEVGQTCTANTTWSYSTAVYVHILVTIRTLATPPQRLLHYTLDVNDPRQVIRDQFDREVPPEELCPNKWLSVVGWRQPSSQIAADYINDPEKVPINSVRFTEPDDYSLGSGTDDLLDSVLARLTQRSA